MERLTIRTPKGAALKMNDTYPNEDAARKDLMRRYSIAMERLAAYEDAGLDPEEIEKAMEDCADTVSKNQFAISDINEMGGIDHLRELAQAEKDGRLVVMSPNTPLTPEELRNLALKKWVWIDVLDASKEYGAGSAYYRKSDCNRPKEVFFCGYPGWEIVFKYADYGKTWLAYHQKPKEETHEQNKN